MDRIPLVILGMFTLSLAASDALVEFPQRMDMDAVRHGPTLAAGTLPAELEAFTISAWVKPKSFDGFNEIFRIESATGRLLFSFQEKGRYLSLGVQGVNYAECDARIDAASVANGCWHHAVGVFNRGSMQVWLDGAMIGAGGVGGDRAKIARDMKGFVGSSGGRGEWFVGSIAELRIMPRALAQLEIISAFNAGEKPYGAKFDYEHLRRSIGERYGEVCEFRPLTAEQFARCGKDERAKWQAFDAWWKGLFPRGLDQATERELVAAVGSAWPLESSPRPSSERVAPWHEPGTPEPRAFDAVSARALIESDWIHQANGAPDPVDELARTEALAARLGTKVPGLDAIRALAAAAKTTNECMAAYLAVRRVKRELMFANPLVKGVKRLLILDSPYPEGSEFRHETRHRMGYMGVPGGQLLSLDGLRPDAAVKRLAPHEPLSGAFWRPDVSYDGERILFCFKPHNEKTFHLYEMKADGTDCRQLTDGMFDDLDPVYLPDGRHYVFTSTRGYTYVRCMPPTGAFSLMRGEFGSDDLYFISANNEPDYLPSVAADGKIVYTRWEYTDKPLWRAQSLWTVNPDGTQANTFWGNQSVWPDVMKDARSIPGSRRVMFTGTAHHNWFLGCIGIVDPDVGNNYPHGLTKVTCEQRWPESGNGPREKPESAAYRSYGAWTGYMSPWPLSERDFLVAARRRDAYAGDWGSFDHYALYLMDTDGNREIVYAGNNNIFHFMPLQPRAKPPVLADRIRFPSRENRLNPEDGSIYSADVHEGVPDSLKGRIRYLRVWYLEQKTYTYWNHRPALSTGPVVSGVQTDGVKRYLGEVPVEEDGSVWFKAPSGIALHFQALDEKHRALQTMRSFVSVQPGESRGCVGCHERTSVIAAGAVPTRGKAFSKPSVIRPAAWDRPGNKLGVAIGYKRDIVPIFKRLCYCCHTGEGKGRRTFDLTEDGWRPYMHIVGWPGWAKKDVMPPWGSVIRQNWPKIDYSNPPPGCDLAGTIKVENFSVVDTNAYVTLPPDTRLSRHSKLVKMLSGELPHHGVKATDEEVFKAVLWVDAICPFLTDADIREDPDPQFPGVDWIIQKPRLKTAPIPVRPGPFSVHADPETVEREYNFQ